MLLDPRSAGPRPPFPKQQQPAPGETQALEPVPDHGEKSYRGNGRFTDCAVLITGGDSGIGRAVAIAFAREGADVAIAYLEEHEDAEETARWVRLAGRRALLIDGDISDPEHCDEVVQRTIDEFGRLDVLINNAAFQRTHEKLEDFTREEVETTFRTNVESMFHLAKAAAPHMKPGSSILNTTSIHPTTLPRNCSLMRRRRVRSRTSRRGLRSCSHRKAFASMRSRPAPYGRR